MKLFVRPFFVLSGAATTLVLAACTSYEPTASMPSKDDRRVVHLVNGGGHTPRDWVVSLTNTTHWRVEGSTYLVRKTIDILTFSGGWYDPTTVDSRSNIMLWTGEPGILFPPLWLIGFLAVVPKLSCEASMTLPPDAAPEYWVSIEWRGPDNSAQLSARPDPGSGGSRSTIIAPCLHHGDLVYRPATAADNPPQEAL
jgi:hypothetical protein